MTQRPPSLEVRDASLEGSRPGLERLAGLIARQAARELCRDGALPIETYNHEKPNRHVPAYDGGDAVLTIKEIAERDRCSEKTVRRAVDAGLLEVIRVGPKGRLVRVHPAAHAAYRRARWE